MVQLLAIQVTPPATEEAHITAVRWYDPGTGQINIATTDVMVKFLNEQHGIAYMYNGRGRADVIATVGPGAHLSTSPGSPGTPRITLLSLPRF
jgi:hypothetical protein